MVRPSTNPLSPEKSTASSSRRHDASASSKTPGGTPHTAGGKTPATRERTSTRTNTSAATTNNTIGAGPVASSQQSQHQKHTEKDRSREKEQDGYTPADRQRDLVNQPANASIGLNDYQLGDCLGKGAFGSVYKALNWGTGETVAVKQVKLADLPKPELRVITQEIDLLKNLDHANIVKYHGFVKSTDSLYIILEYCENGSLHSICKKFGKFPENLVALYMSQVLHGLLYLHEQGVIHRDIKGANILTTKEGLVKLADFGVATKATGIHEASVVGTPYWMAPEVIELAGATTASDIWSLGCTVIELLEGKPPYHKLQPMPALFRIVNDEHPPLPESASPMVQDFLMQCFQKNPNLRVSAKKLLKHPWIVNAKRTDSKQPVKLTKYDEAVKSVQEWNEALKSPNIGTFRKIGPTNRPNHNKTDRPEQITSSIANPPYLGKATIDAANNQRPTADQFRSPESAESDNWDDDFASSISVTALQLPHLRPIDNYAGQHSVNKLKQNPANNSVMSNDDDGGTLRSNANLNNVSDPLQTVRASSPNKTRDGAILTQTNQSLPKQARSGLPNSSSSTNRPIPSVERARPQMKRSSSIFRESAVEDYSDLAGGEDDASFEMKFLTFIKNNENFSPKFTHVTDLQKATKGQKPNIANGTTTQNTNRPANTASSLAIHKYSDNIEDEDYSDIFVDDSESYDGTGNEADMETRLSVTLGGANNSWVFTDDDDDENADPFAELEEHLDNGDLETKVARDKYVRMCAEVSEIIGSLQIPQPEDSLADMTDQLMELLFENPDLRDVVISSHGLIPILEILERSQNRDLVLCLLKIVNLIIINNFELLESFCLLGGIPIVVKFAHRKFPSDIRLEAAAFIRQVCQASTLTLQMFISCAGLNVLVEFLEEDYDSERDLVLVGVNGVWSVFELQGSTPKNDFCRIFSRNSALYPLSLVLNRVLDEEGELADLVEGRIANIFFIFSQAENYVKESVADRMVLKTVLRDLRRMSPPHQITMLKFIKNLSMLSTTLDSLQNSNAIESLTELLKSNMNAPHFRELSSQILNTMYNLCRLDKTRQEDAALSGIIPVLQKVITIDRPLKEFALPILCDMAYSGGVGRKALWQNKGLGFYISLLEDHYWRATALDAIFIWLQEETARVEEQLLKGSFSEAIMHCFMDTKHPDAFDNMLEPLQKLLRLSPPVAATLARAEIFLRVEHKLHNKKAIVRGNLLRIMRSICEATEDAVILLHKHNLYDLIVGMIDGDPAILVGNLASELIRSVDGASRFSPSGESRSRALTRKSSSSFAQAAFSNSSQPPTPQKGVHASQQLSGYFDSASDLKSIPASPISKTGPIMSYRPTSRDGKPNVNDMFDANGMQLGNKSRLPRVNVTRSSRLSMGTRHSHHASNRRGDSSPFQSAGSTTGSTSDITTSSSSSSTNVHRASSVLSPLKKRRPTNGFG